MCSLFGMDDFKEFREKLNEVPNGYNESGRSYICNRLYELEDEIDERVRENLGKYDENIYSYLERMNDNREEPIELKYFQYLSVLFSEIYLDFYFSDPIGFLNEITEFAHENKDKYPDKPPERLLTFLPEDMNRLGYYMAMGSGKTLIMHINYMQFMNYNEGENKIDYDNILLITPNEGLSEQHMEKMKSSKVPSEHLIYDSNNVSSIEYKGDPIKVVEITKFTEKKTGEGVKIELEWLGSNNLVFADEAHKGSSGDKWINHRKYLSRDGFMFDYSATFGQALNEINPKHELLQTYAKSIAFDYSYKYFYKDGFGKDYRILNLDEKEFSDELMDTLLLGNTLSFYEQYKVFNDKEDLKDIYNIEKPLWVFVGNTVDPKKTKSKLGKYEEKAISDVLRVLTFIHKFVNNKEWAIDTIENILSGNSGILNKSGEDIFAKTYPETKFPFLRRKGYNWDSEEIYKWIRKSIFHATGPMKLHLTDLKKAEGEIGLSFGSGRKNYFGVINIGNDKAFLKTIRDEHEEDFFVVEEDEFSPSLFGELGKSDSQVNLLLGAKKFIEGWDSWRVSTMGLINMGRSRGPQVIQLFGRGVRLKGYENSLKRSSHIKDVDHPTYLPVLETLNVFGVRAKYMEEFRNYLEKEDVPIEQTIEYELPLKIDSKIKREETELVVPRVEESKTFESEFFFKLRKDSDVTKITRDFMKTKVSTTFSPELDEDEISDELERSEKHISPQYLDLLNWNKIRAEILEYKREKDMTNIIISKDSLKKILHPDKEGNYCYDLFVHKEKINPNNLNNLDVLEKYAIRILKEYVRRYYNLKERQWEQENMTYYQLTPNDPNFFEKYVIGIDETDLERFEEVIEILEDDENIDQVYGNFNTILENVYIDKHLYQPLLAEHDDISITPQPINPGEKDFIEDLKNYLIANQNKIEENDSDIYILRNLPHGKGICFFESHGFYPDFIIWIKREDFQHLLFVDPHGFGHFDELDQEKIQLRKRIKCLQKELQDRTENEVKLDSYMVSVTKFDKVKYRVEARDKSELEEKNVFFMEDDPNYIEKIMGPHLDV